MSKIGMYTKARVFGFTASPHGRHDGRDIEMEAVCGPVLYTMTYQQAQAIGRVVPINVEWLAVEEGPCVAGLDPVSRDRIGVWQNDYRNQLIADRARKTAPQDQTMIMVKTIDHIVRLKALLPEYTMIYGADGMDAERIAGYVKQGLLPDGEQPLSSKKLLELRKQFAAGTLTKVIANYVWSTGVNFRKLAVLIRGDASGSELKDVQIPGRACRPVPGEKNSAILVDCWDSFDSTLLERAVGRRRSYNSRGWVEKFLRPSTSQLR
jgi:superfamily II DNA or RNA helicase